MNCPGLNYGDGFLLNALAQLDCQGRVIGTQGYQALAATSSPLAAVLTSAITVFIALIGLRMVVGYTPSVRDGVAAAVKVGVVVVLATSWSAYQPLAYDVLTRGPDQLSDVVAGSSGLARPSGDLAPRLQQADVAIARLTTLGSGRSDITARALAPAGQTPAVERSPLQDDIGFGAARMVFLSTLLATATLTKLGAGVLLATGPLFALFLLFEATWPLASGWMRAMLFTLLLSVAASLVFAVQLALMEPWLVQALALRQNNYLALDAPVQLLVICVTFGLAITGTALLLLKLCFATHVPAAVHTALVRWRDSLNPTTAPRAGGARAEPPASRAEMISRQISLSDRSSAAVYSGAGVLRGDQTSGAPSSSNVAPRASSLRRTPRASRLATLRDRQS